MKNIKTFLTNKNIIIISAVIISVAVAGVSAIAVANNTDLFGEPKYNLVSTYPGTSEPEKDESIVSEKQNENVIQNTETATSQPSVSTNQVETQKQLSPEELAMREEIAKVSNTTIEFPYTRQIEFNGVTYDAVYYKLTQSLRLDAYRIVYKTDNGDIFEYDLSNGELYDIELISLSNVVTENIISENEALNIAQSYYNSEKFSGYTFDECMERDYGYAVRFLAPKYKGYETDDCIVIMVNNDGAVCGLSISDFHYNDLDYNIDHAKVQEKMQLPLHQGDEPTTVRMICYNGNVSLLISPVNSNAIPYYSIEQFLED